MCLCLGRLPYIFIIPSPTNSHTYTYTNTHTQHATSCTGCWTKTSSVTPSSWSLPTSKICPRRWMPQRWRTSWASPPSATDSGTSRYFFFYIHTWTHTHLSFTIHYILIPFFCTYIYTHTRTHTGLLRDKWGWPLRGPRLALGSPAEAKVNKFHPHTSGAKFKVHPLLIISDISTHTHTYNTYTNPQLATSGAWRKGWCPCNLLFIFFSIYKHKKMAAIFSNTREEDCWKQKKRKGRKEKGACTHESSKKETD